MPLMQNSERLAQKIATLSQRAQDKLDGQNYLINIESDSATAPNVVELLFMELIQDMSEQGLVFTVPAIDICSNAICFESMLDAMQYLFPNTLYPKLKQDANLTDRIDDILTGGVSDEPTVVELLSFIGGTSTGMPYVRAIQSGCAFLVTRITSNELFDIVLRNLVDLVKAERRVVSVTPQEYDDVIRYTTQKLRMFATAVEIISRIKTNKDLLSILDAWIYETITGMTLPENVATTRWRFLTNTNTLSDDGKRLHALAIREFYASCKLCPSYKSVRLEQPEEVDFLGYLCYWFAECKTKEEFTRIASRYFATRKLDQSADLIDALTAEFGKSFV